MLNVRKILFQIKRRLLVAAGRRFPHWTRSIKVGSWHIEGPFNHLLDMYKERLRLYDYFLPALCKVMAGLGDRGVIVDVGANIGDTVALIRQEGVVNRVIAIEASSEFFDLLERNVKAAPRKFGDVQLIKAFVGKENAQLVLKYSNGTAGTREVSGGSEGRGVPVMTLSQLGESEIALLKIDTDGYDGAILEGNAEFINSLAPIVWAEAYVDSDDSLISWKNALGVLGARYKHIFLFDNVGRPVFSGALNPESISWVIGLIRYAWIQRVLESSGEGSCGQAYFDIALFPEGKEEIRDAFVEFVDQAIWELGDVHFQTPSGGGNSMKVSA